MSPLRFLAGLACLAVTIAAVLVAILAWRAMERLDDVDRAVDDVSRSAERLDARTRDLRPAVRELRDAARALGGVPPTTP